jgi:hypothetical protein
MIWRSPTPWVDGDIELLEDPLGPPIDLGPVDDPEAVGQSTERDVLGHRQRGSVLELLEDDGDPKVASADGGQGGVGDTVHDDVARVCRVVPRDDLDEGGLAGTVLAEQCQDGTADGLEIHPVEDLDATERLADALRLKGEGHAAFSVRILVVNRPGFPGRPHGCSRW